MKDGTGRTTTVKFRLLGHMHATSGDGEEVELGPAKQRSVLAMLLSDVGEVVLADQLVDGLWGAAPPPGARGTLYSYVARLRRALHAHGVELRRHTGGYVLQVEQEQVDLHRFLRLVDEAQAVHEGPRAAALLHEALSLCRRELLVGLPGPWAAGTRTRLEQVRVAAALRYHEIQLAAGRAEEIVARIYELAMAHPLDERLAAQLMTALYQCGRQAEAVQVYEAVKENLGSRLGVAPGPDLRGVLLRVLPDRHPAAPAASAVAPHAAPHAAPVAGVHLVGAPVVGAPVVGRPRQLPAALADFTGRDQALDEVVRHLAGSSEHGVGLAVIAGPGGVGKSALAVQAAHRLCQSFPGGQLYVDLHGLDPRPADPAEVLERFLRALGVHRTAIPDGLEPRAEMYRDLLAERRVTVVLDGAGGEAQVQPLLPGAPGSAVLVTSRYRLPGLPGARPWQLGMLPRHDALDLLRAIAGHERFEREPRASDELVRLCAGLPLAVRVAGARLAARPHWPVGRLAARLADPRLCLDELSHGTADVRATLAAGYRLLEEPARRLFTSLGLDGRTRFSAATAAALLGADLPAAHDLLARLVEVCLLDAAGGDEFVIHPLTVVYARERGQAEERATARTGS
ncbi:AfsR/SARP family transcriptional regulator [Nonomuraea wenchangensis]|uniref:AfsR/SARP family transcriptional regulator n=1 Tax=Nonomuraea wenchangensis TaxID=568860 RepID=UPI0033D8A5E7